MTGGMNHGEIAAALRGRRETLGLSQVAVARRARVSPRSILAWELGQHAPGLPETVAWAGAVGYELVLRERAS